MSSKTPVFNFDEIVNVDDRIMVDVVSLLSDEDISLSLLNESANLKTKFFRNMSSRRESIIREDMLVKMADYTELGVKLAQKKVIDTINRKILEDLSKA